MIYIFTIIVIICLIFKYDINNFSKKKSYNVWYNIMMVWFICISGFAYNIGSDTVIYMNEYDNAIWDNIHNLNDLFYNNERRQPGWIILETICHSISSNFLFFKLIIALFGNWAIFRFIKKHSEYKFISILLYGFILYLHLNFNALRQILAVGLFLIGYDYLIERKLFKYYILVIFAYLFHSSAIICTLFPLFLLIKVNRKSLIMIGCITISLSFLAFFSDIQQYLELFYVYYGGDMSSDLQYFSESYFTREQGTNLNLTGILFILFNAFVYLFMLYWALRPKSNSENNTKMYLLFLSFYILNFNFQVIFFRLLFYVYPFFICILPSGIMNYAKQNSQTKLLISIIAITYFSIIPLASLFTINQTTDEPLIVQYYPYYSVFNPEIDPTRSALFGWHK